MSVSPWQAPVTVHLANLPTRTEANTAGHWAPKHRRARAQRRATYLWLRHLLPPTPPAMPVRITVVRVAPRLLDSHDNLASALKHVVDGISDYLAGGYLQGEDRQPGLTWEYGQQRGKAHEYAVEVIVAPGARGR